MNILNKITDFKRREVEERKNLYPVKLLERSLYFESPVVSLEKYLRREEKSGIIAEFKRQSPSKGVINAYAEVESTSISYMQSGASALSVLTDAHFFGGSNDDLKTARKFNFCPILRKEFIIDEYQVFEARSIGADAILLIAEILDQKKLKALASRAKSLGMEVLCEVHSAEQLNKLNSNVNLVGVNNRNLETFETDVETSFQLIDQIPPQFLKVSESGIDDPEIIFQLKRAGFEGFLIGEYFMRSANPGKKCRQFTEKLEKLEKLHKLSQGKHAG